ncbi:hypothetical protein [Methanofollis ethanolicus]|uniref:hypothetical protein n=1 Tax=Methanofollis ethanolicus TaxID=488124 RepID=UPI00082BF010|nr:hypothetical protein [Methanofollis ethanolicus]
MDRWITTAALALLLALLLASGAGATAEDVTVTVTGVRMETANIEIVPVAPPDDVIAITYDTPESNMYTITGLITTETAFGTGGGGDAGVNATVDVRNGTSPAVDYITINSASAVYSNKESILVVKVRNDTLPAANYITVHSATTVDATEEVCGAAPRLYSAAAVKNAAPTQPAIPILSLSRYYSLDVPDPEKTLWVDMRWEGDGDHALTVYHPGGILGTFRDGSDGKEDDRIFLRLSRDGGVGTGAWTFKMTAPLAASRENATIQTYLE